MEIIRRATLEEVLALENITETASSVTGSVIMLAPITFLIVLIFGLVLQSDHLFMGGMIMTFVSIAGGLYYANVHMASQEQALYNDSNYYVAIIDDSETFEHDDYTLIDHHDGNAYFVELVR